MLVGKANVVAPAGTVTASPPSSVSTRPEPFRPVTVPLTAYAFVVHVTATAATLLPARTPVALAVTLHVWVGPAGCFWTATV